MNSAKGSYGRQLSFLTLLLLSLAGLPSSLSADYKVVLKDGKVIEARTKPVSMEGHYRFTDPQNQFHAIPLHLIDVDATQALNAASDSKSKSARVLSNEDISSKSSKSTSSPAGSEQPDPARSKLAATSQPKPEPGTRKGEAYWRSQAKQIRDEMLRIDSEIEALNEKIKSGKGDGVKIGFDTYNQVIYANFESKLKELEKQREKLQKMKAALEEDARKAGALPGWLR
jgi:hypothetical protein